MFDVEILDSTLRDGAQAEGISFTVQDKIAIVKKLDKLGISYIEAGNPFSNSKDILFFNEAKKLQLNHAKLVAFGSTRHKDSKVSEDDGVKALLSSNVDVVSIFGKSSSAQVKDVLKTTCEENLLMIKETVSYLKSAGKTVFFDAEHFFDGFNLNHEYALQTILVARDAGADMIILCDTNGASLAEDVFAITKQVKEKLQMKIGIHCHNDIGCAVACSISAVKAGATQVQGTYLGFGERCGNTNLSTIIPLLQLKLKVNCIPKECLARLTKTARFVAEVSNIALSHNLPFVGKSAFAHKGGMHVDGVCKNASSFEHITPESVGNKRSILISEMAGRTAMLNVINDVDKSIQRDSKEAIELVDLLKEQEAKGYLFESATASLELLIAKHLHKFKPFFELVHFKVIGEQVKGYKPLLSSAMIKIKVDDKTEITAGEGEGPVNALDIALKKAVISFYPEAKNMHLIDYKVRVIEPNDATAALVRVFIVSSDGVDIWTTVGVSRDIIDASLQALTDSIEYKLMNSNKKLI